MERDPSHPRCYDQAVKRLRQAVRVPRYSVMTDHKLTCADPSLPGTMLFQRLNTQRWERNRTPTALRLWRLERRLAFRTL